MSTDKEDKDLLRENILNLFELSKALLNRIQNLEDEVKKLADIVGDMLEREFPGITKKEYKNDNTAN